MGKKRKASGRNEKAAGPKEVDPADARLGPITTYEDVANSEDEYFLNRDKIMFNEGPQTKRQRRQEEEDKFLEMSEEEIMDDDDDSDEEDEEDEEDADIPARNAAPASAGRKRGAAGSDDEDEHQKDGEDIGDSGWWGDSKTEYYDADQIETEADALEEEAEAKRLQQKKLSKMAEEDFLFDESAWLDSKADGEEDGDDVVTEVLKDVEVTDDMTPDDRAKLLRSRYPEFEHLVAEFQELQPKLALLQKEAAGKPGKSIEAVRYWVLGCYVAALASYFAILTSPSRDGSTTSKVLNPSELRDHEVMETLVSCRNAWQRLGQVRAISKDEPSMAIELPAANGLATAVPHTKEERRKLQQERKQRKAKDKAKKAKDKRAKEIEESLADLDNLLRTQQKRSSRASKAAAAAAAAAEVNGTATTEGDDDDKSDFGEEEFLDARTAKDKAARKKSLRFYTSQIVQKANRRADAGRDAGGDMDIPYRERLKDRQARLNAEAERRGKKFGADLGDGDDDDSNDEADGKAARGRDEDDEYYDMVAGAAKKKKEEKAARQAALAAASRADRVVEQEVIGEDGKRKITYAIEKNKGLAPKRKKEQRNPRVKKKMQYDAKQKKLRSMKATFKGGEPRGGYGGELTGISTHVVRSTKL